MNKRIGLAVIAVVVLSATAVFALNMRSEEPQMVSCEATPTFLPSDTKRYVTPEEAVSAEIALDGEPPPVAMEVIFRYPDPDIHDVRVQADWEDRQEMYGVGGVELDGEVRWLAQGPLEPC